MVVLVTEDEASAALGKQVKTVGDQGGSTGPVSMCSYQAAAGDNFSVTLWVLAGDRYFTVAYSGEGDPEQVTHEAAVAAVGRL